MKNKHIRILLTCGIIIACPTPLQSNIGISLACLGIGMASSYGGYKWLRKKETFVPNEKNINALTLRPCDIPTEAIPDRSLETLVQEIRAGKSPESAYIRIPKQPGQYILYQQGVITNEDDATIFICSRGYAKKERPLLASNSNNQDPEDHFVKHGACAVAAYTQMLHNIVNDAPCVSFDYPDQRTLFNFGQKTDLSCLETIYKSVREKSPHAAIVLIGDCRGARTALKFSLNHPRHIKAVILMSPFFSARSLTNCIAQNYLKWLPRSPDILYSFFKMWFPNYHEQEDQTFESAPTNSAYPPILISHRIGDTLVEDHEVEKLVKQLRRHKNTSVYFLPIRDRSAPHSRLTNIKLFQHGANTFLQKHALPHNASLTSHRESLANFMLNAQECITAPTPLTSRTQYKTVDKKKRRQTKKDHLLSYTYHKDMSALRISNQLIQRAPHLLQKLSWKSLHDDQL